jgi:hypothetical protein
MTLAPTNEAFSHENCAEKNLDVEKNYRYDLGGHARYKATIKKRKIL